MIIIYKLEKIKEKVLYSDSTNFVEIKYLNKIKSMLKNEKYNIYRPFEEATKVILYKKKVPEIRIYEIISNVLLRHQDILGTLYSLNISDEMFGDVVVDNNKYFIIIMPLLEEYIKSNLTCIRNSNVNLILRESDCLKKYEQKYEEKEIIVSSLRIDLVISKIINTSRSNLVNIIKNKDILINYEILNKSTYVLKENDIFSIRKYGKYKFLCVKNKTKNNNLVIKYLKYI